MVMSEAEAAGPTIGRDHSFEVTTWSKCSGYKNGAKQSMTVHAVIVTPRNLFVVFGLEDLATTIKAVWADVMTQVSLTRS